MILVDSSAWIELFRASGHPAHKTLKHHLEKGSSIATTEIVIMELLAGVSDSRGRKRLRQRLLEIPLLRLRGLSDFESAAELYQSCRRRGATVRKLIDCVIATVAIRERVTVLHNDRDFDALRRHSDLRIEPYVAA